MNTETYETVPAVPETTPDGRPWSEATEADIAYHEYVRAVVQDGKPLTDDDMEAVSGGLTFRDDNEWDRHRLWHFAFWNGEIGVMGDIMSGKPLSQISWRP